MPLFDSGARSFFGMLQLGEALSGSHFVELAADPHASREMRAVIHLNPEVFAFGLGSPHSTGLTIVGPGVRIETGDGLSVSHNRVSAPIRCLDETLYEDDEVVPVRYSFGFRFPVTSLTGDPYDVVRDPSVGLSLGRVERQSGRRTEVTPLPPVCVTLDGVEIEIASEFSFRSGGAARYPEETLVRESVLAFSVEAPEASRAPPHERARGLADAVLQFVGVLERDRIRWTRQSTAAHGADRVPAGQWRRTRWSSPPRPGATRHPYDDGSEALARLVTAYDALEAPDRSVVDLVCREFEIASTAGDVETSLVRWHSVMDFFCKRAGCDTRGKSASKRILDTCDAAGVELSDIVDAADLTRVREGARGATFAFTRLRNAFVHDGFDVFEGRFAELHDAEQEARAVAERLLLSCLHLDTESGPLGTVAERMPTGGGAFERSR